jgi:ABC-2 type transport system permease protein
VNSILPVMKKELRSSFNSPIAYIAVLAFLVMTTFVFFFVMHFFANKEATLRGFFDIIPWAFIFLVPALTMRSWAEERKMGTIELLTTLPFSEWSLVLAKYVAALILLCIMLVLTLPIPIMLSLFGRFDAGEIAGQYLGVLFMGSASIAVGVFISNMAKNQVSAFIITFLVLLVLMFVGQAWASIGLLRGILPALRWLTMNEHFGNFSKGVVDSRDVAYFVIVTAVFLYLNVFNLVSRKWR